MNKATKFIMTLWISMCIFVIPSMYLRIGTGSCSRITGCDKILFEHFLSYLLIVLLYTIILYIFMRCTEDEIKRKS